MVAKFLYRNGTYWLASLRGVILGIIISLERLNALDKLRLLRPINFLIVFFENVSDHQVVAVGQLGGATIDAQLRFAQSGHSTCD